MILIALFASALACGTAKHNMSELFQSTYYQTPINGACAGAEVCKNSNPTYNNKMPWAGDL